MWWCPWLHYKTRLQPTVLPTGRKRHIKGRPATSPVLSAGYQCLQLTCSYRSALTLKTKQTWHNAMDACTRYDKGLLCFMPGDLCPIPLRVPSSVQSACSHNKICSCSFAQMCVLGLRLNTIQMAKCMLVFGGACLYTCILVGVRVYFFSDIGVHDFLCRCGFTWVPVVSG